MKETGITIRINSELKKTFKSICDSESTTISDKLYKYILKEVDSYESNNLLDNLIKGFGYKNVTLVNSPVIYWDGEKVVDYNSSSIQIMMCTYNMSLKEFLDANKEYKMLLFLNPKKDNKHVRGYVFK